MVTGPEMMLGALLRALGFDAQKTATDLVDFIAWVQTQISDSTARLDRIENMLDILLAYQQDRIVQHPEQESPNERTHRIADRTGTDPAGGRNLATGAVGGGSRGGNSHATE